MATEALSEAEKLRLVPGIYFGTEPAGRYAKVTGTGIDVWQIIDAYTSMDRSLPRLRYTFHWLSEAQLQAALRYYSLFPDEIDEKLAREAEITPEWIAAHFPLKPGQPHPRRT